jgi:tRNA threonylcarbamoyladenosine biosynthesis protein TsaB
MPLAALLQAGRGRIAVSWYKASNDESKRAGLGDRGGENTWKSQGAAQVTTVDALADAIDKPTLIAGELTAAERQRLARKKVNVVLAPPSACVRRPSILAELAWVRWKAGSVDEPASLAPIYLQLAESIPA